MPSFFQRLSAAASAAAEGFLGRQARGMDYGYLPPSFQTSVQRQFGLPPPLRAQESQQSYSDNPWLYSGVNVIANEVARTKFRLVLNPEEEDQMPVDAHQAAETLAHPQPLASGKTMLTSMQLMLLTTQYLFLNGECFWLLDGRTTPGNSPTVLSPLNPAYVYEKLNADGTLGNYVYRFVGGPNGAPSGGWEIPPEDVVHFKFPDLKNWYRGLSPVQPIRYGLESYREADVLNAMRLRNNAVPAGTLESPNEVSDQQRKKIMDAWRENYGGPNNSGKIAMLPNGFKFNPTQMSNQDMQFIEGKNLTRDEILADLRVGMEMLGKTESKTRANADASIYVFSRFTVKPVLDLIADTLTHDYLPAFPATEKMGFVFDNPVPEDDEAKRANMKALFDSGALTPDEARQMMGLDPLNLPGTDVPYVNFSLMPVGSPQPAAPPAFPEGNTNPPTDKQKKNAPAAPPATKAEESRR